MGNRRWIGASWAAAALGLMIVSHGAAADDYSDCGKSGYGVAGCPSFGNEPARRQTHAPAIQYEEPADDCTKTGWGTPLCPGYGKKPPAKTTSEKPEESSKTPSQEPAVKYQSPQDECGKTGWGVTECPNYGRKPTSG